MIRYLHYLICFAILIVSGIGYAQISPGDLAEPHAKLEGMSNCTQCHEIGEKVVNSKCLECHTEIKSLIGEHKGFHASTEVKDKDCIQCHSDHHGRKFDMARFNEDAFKHDLTGYILEGKHETVDCRKCHMPDNIKSAELSKRKNTFLGLDSKCLSCHDDFHQKTLSNDCSSCHTMDGFKPASNFDHNKADFKLLGKHVDVDCIECHAVTTRNGKEFQNFSDVAFNDCKSCHDDAHKGQIAGACNQCHVETSFSTFDGRGRFDHKLTGFNLNGSHKNIDCFTCHKKSGNPLTVFQDNINIRENDCAKCHKDVHEGKYGNQCAKCHKESSFLSLKAMKFFDHTIADYPLEGKHKEVDCRECHTKSFSTPINFAECKNCHTDYHKGEFAKNGISPDCVQCHSLQEGFDYSLMTIEKHQQTKFPLEGAHTATPCYACHLDEKQKRWTFINMGSQCADCHKDIHDMYINKKYYPNNKCNICHVNDRWSLVNFNHDLTNWPLQGRHEKVDCRDCHMEVSDNKITAQHFIGLNTNCASCHENIHGNTFAIKGVTDCARCHVTESWYPKKFNHNNTAFPLKGRHQDVDCKECHSIANADGTTQVIYKLRKFECVDCHQ